jgi:hypothetical protein
VDTGARDRGGRGFGSWFKPRKTGSFPRGTETSRKAFFLSEKKTTRLWHISLRFFTFFPLSHEPEKPPDARTSRAKLKRPTRHANGTVALFVRFLIGVFREDT